MKSFFTTFLILLWVRFTTSFVPTPVPQRTVTFQPARKISGWKPTYSKQTIIVLNMSEESENKPNDDSVVAPKPGKAFYDDEVRI